MTHGAVAGVVSGTRRCIKARTREGMTRWDDVACLSVGDLQRCLRWRTRGDDDNLLSVVPVDIADDVAGHRPEAPHAF
jgi:hypothetical protein